MVFIKNLFGLLGISLLMVGAVGLAPLFYGGEIENRVLLGFGVAAAFFGGGFLLYLFHRIEVSWIRNRSEAERALDAKISKGLSWFGVLTLIAWLLFFTFLGPLLAIVIVALLISGIAIAFKQTVMAFIAPVVRGLLKKDGKALFHTTSANTEHDNDELNRLILSLNELEFDARPLDKINDIKAIERLGDIGDPVALLVLQQLSKHIHMDVARAADKAIEKINAINKINNRTDDDINTPPWIDSIEANTPEKIAYCFVRNELNKEKPDFHSFQKKLEQFSEGYEINNGWTTLVIKCQDHGKKWLCNQCALKGLSYYPEPRVTTWDMIDISDDVPKAEILRAKISQIYRGESNKALRTMVLTCLRNIYGEPGEREKNKDELRMITVNI